MSAPPPPPSIFGSGQKVDFALGDAFSASGLFTNARLQEGQPAGVGKGEGSENNPPAEHLSASGMGTAKLRAKIIELNSEIERLHSENEECKEECEDYLARMRKDNAYYRTQNAELTKRNIELKATQQKSSSDFTTKVASYNSSIEKHKMDIDSLQKDLHKVTEERDSARDNYGYLETQMKEEKKNHDSTKKKLQDSETNHSATRDKLAATESDLKNEKKVLGDAQDRISQLEGDVIRLQTQIDSEKAAAKRVKELCDRQTEEIKDRSKDNKGISALLTTSQAEAEILKSEIAVLNESLAGYSTCQQELAAERAVTQNMREQLAKMRAEPTNRFPLDPQAFQPKSLDGKKPVIPQVMNLADELGDGLSGPQSTPLRSTSDGGSQHDSQSTDAGSENGSLELSSGDDVEYAAPASEPRVQIVYKYMQYQTYAHNPFKCWFTVEYEFFILLCILVSDAWSAISPLLRQILGLGSYSGNAGIQGTSQQPGTPANGSDGNNRSLVPGAPMMMMKIAATGNTSPDSVQPDTLAPNTDATLPIGTSIPLPASPPTPGRDVPLSTLLGPIPQIGHREHIPSAPGTPHERSSNNYNDIGGLPPPPNGTDYSVRGIRKSSWARSSAHILEHIIVYYGLIMCIMTVMERRVWLRSNETTRSLVNELLLMRSNYCHQERGWASVFFPERWVAFIDMSMLNIAKLFRFQVKSFRVPG